MNSSETEEQEVKAPPPRLTPKEALAKRRAEHLAWKREFFHTRPPPVCLGRLHRRQASPIGRSVASSFKRARELVNQAASLSSPPASQLADVTTTTTTTAAAAAAAAASAAVGRLAHGDDTAVEELAPPRLQRRREWCARMRREVASRDPFTDVKIRSDPRRTLVFSHLHDDTTEADLRLFAEQIGHVESVHLIRNKSTGASRRYAFVEYRYLADATKAVQFSGKKRLHGRVVNIDAERGRTQAGFLPQRFAEAARYDSSVRATQPAAAEKPASQPATTAQEIINMSEEDFLNAMLNS